MTGGTRTVFEDLAPGGLSNYWSCAVPRYSAEDFADAERAGEAYPPAGTTTYTYDELGYLTRLQLPDGRDITYAVDGAGRRVEKRIGGTRVAGWLYDGSRIIAELDSTRAVASTFSYGVDQSVPAVLVKGSNTYRILTDHLGSVRMVVDVASGSIAQALDYDECGRVTRDTDPGFQPFGFVSGHYDPDTKLVRFGTRDYDPEVGRWTTPDPLQFAGHSTNLYEYASDDPVNTRDRMGLDGCPACKSAIGSDTLQNWVGPPGSASPTYPDIDKALGMSLLWP